MNERRVEEHWLSFRLHQPELSVLSAFTLVLWSRLLKREFMGPTQMALLTLSFLMWLLALLGFSFRARQAFLRREKRVFRRMCCLAVCMVLVVLRQGVLARSRLQKGTVANFLDAEYGVREFEYLSAELNFVSFDLSQAQQRTLVSALMTLPCRTWGPEPADEMRYDFLVYYKGNAYDNENPGAYVQEEFSWSLHWMDGGVFSLSDRHTGKRWTVAVDADWKSLLEKVLKTP